MEIIEKCMDCIDNQAKKAISFCFEKEDKRKEDKRKEEAYKDIKKEFENIKKYRNAPEFVRKIQAIIMEKSGVSDPYKTVKEKDLKAALSVINLLREYVSEGDKLMNALKVSAIGNNLDAAIYNDVDVESCIKTELKKEFEICDIEIFREKLENAKKILIIGDNTGETVFDRVLIENLGEKEFFYAVRNEPILNDTTYKEAVDSGLLEVSTIISTGSSVPGVILEECNKEFIDIFNSSDIIISKGQGNIETLFETERDIFFLLKTKCSVVGEHLGQKLNNYVFRYKGVK